MLRGTMPPMKLHIAFGLAALAGLISAPAVSAASYLIDFGMAASMNPTTQGAPTTSPDINGNHWNNVTSTGYANNIAGGTGTTLSNLVSVNNIQSSIGLTLSSGWKSSGIANGGLNQNTPALGTFGIQTATQDYYFVDGVNGTSATLTLTGLNPALVYNLGLFGTRAADGVRTTGYSVTDVNGTHSTTLQTTGIGSGTGDSTGNNNTIVHLNGLVPNGSGELTMSMSVVNGGFGYLGVMEITAIPEPSAALLCGLGALGLISLRRRPAH